MTALRVLWLVALITVAACGGSGNEPTKQTPNFQGQWTGSYTVTNCTNTGDLTGICTIFGAGGFGFNLTQNNTSTSGTLTLGLVPASVTGTIDTNDGVMNVSGSGTFPENIGTLSIASTRFTVAGPNMFGTFQGTISSIAPSTGAASFTGTLAGVVRQ